MSIHLVMIVGKLKMNNKVFPCFQDFSKYVGIILPGEQVTVEVNKRRHAADEQLRTEEK